MTSRVSALVVTFHTGPRLRECLYVLSSEPAVDEIVIIDNGNPKADQDWLDDFASRKRQVTLERVGDNPGFGTAVNRAAKIASGTEFLVINPDCVLRRGSIAPLRHVIETHPGPCIAGGKIFDQSGTEQRGGRRHTLTLLRAMGVSKWTLENDPAPTGPIRVGAVSGAFFFISAENFKALGGFDENYFLHVEDLDLCRRAIMAGGSVVYVPAAGALHYTSTSDAPSHVVKRHKIDSLKYYLRKFAGGPIEKVCINLVMPFLGWAISLRR